MSLSGYDAIVYFTRISPYLTFVKWTVEWVLSSL